ncbi:helix-turn-helix transcriptional regulator [Vibrio sp. SCSIO 43136]|uniref:helix-turn-helix domain-containing protein n=1 Tax=Vibrio sp. SCSIO 43136 TaxID=2819101 RepID=UPI002074B884|nr:helix-turn-helix transcriptional regulator [Vibrio sp. SCSIO 43136]USD67546.1 AraC family transcriptional regulator [Vibrio sp. SCSIO 43136]
MHIPNVGFNHQQSNQSEFQIINLADLYQRSDLNPDPQTPHRVSFFLFVIIETGSGYHMVDFEQYAYQPGSVIFIQREQVHQFDFTHQPTGKVILFTQAFLDQIHANMRLPNYTPTHLNQHHSPLFELTGDQGRSFTTLLNELITELARTDKDPLISMYLFSTLALILHRIRPDMRHDKLSSQQSVRLARFFELLQSNGQKVRDANWYATQINTTYKTLNQICKLAANLTAKQMIDAYTIIEIKRQLVVTNITTAQIAYDFGFEDVSNFVKYFKNLTKQTPAQFQKQYQSPKV